MRTLTRLFRKETDGAEALFQLFVSDLKTKGFDVMIFNRKEIKRYSGKGLYETWKKALGALRYRKITITFNEAAPKLSWPSDNYPDRLVVNIARAPDKEVLLRTEKELIDFLELEKEIS